MLKKIRCFLMKKDKITFIRKKIKEKKIKYPELINPVLKETIIFAPHPDDEVIGCGGLIAYLNENKIKVKIVYMTDGRYGVTGINPIDVIKIREKEAKKGLSYLNESYIETKFLGIEDGKLFENKRIAKIELKKIIKDNVNIIIPNIYDNHIDHRVTSEIVIEILKKMKFRNIELWNYELWSAIIPNILIDITKYIDVKVKMINAHESQVEHIDYTDKILGLNKYRSITTGVKEITHCEAYYRI